MGNRTYKTQPRTENADGEERQELTRLDYREIRKEEGKFTFSFDLMKYRDDAGTDDAGIVISLINTATAEVVFAWETPSPNALFEVANPDGVRLMNAITRAWDITEELSGHDIATMISNDGGGTLLISKHKMSNGYDAWRWTVKQS